MSLLSIAAFSRRAHSGLRRMGVATVALLMLPLALAGEGVHLGVSTCANSTCHGSKAPLPGALVEQNEFLVWSQFDKHAKSFNALKGERGQKIAANLGLGPAEQAGACLSCHADQAPASLSGKGFSLADGVGCEACHGGASNWLGVHASGVNSHAENVAAGLYPTDDPTARAKLCLGCHLFKDDGGSQHRYYAAGHPRLRFELDTYTEERPGHHRIDADYRKRKPGSYGSRAWVLGQVAASRKIVDRLLSGKDGALWPDYAVFACFGCHRRFGDGEPGSGGLPPLQDAPIRLSALALSTLGSASGAKLDNALDTLNQAFAAAGSSGWRPAAIKLAAQLAAAEKELRARSEQATDAGLLYQAVLGRAANGQFARHHLAEQATYALATLRLADPALATASSEANDQAMDELFATAGMAATFEPARWQQAARSLASPGQASPPSQQ